jgi:formylglycine-generating enzyme required for sulfatase activity
MSENGSNQNQQTQTMKTKLLNLIVALAVLACLSTLNQRLSASPLGTAFTYQGRLTDGGLSAQGIYDLRFSLHDAAIGGYQFEVVQTNAATSVSNGLFTVMLDFGGGVFAGPARWLEMGVRTNGGGAFATLSPRQEITPTPYALFTPNAGLASHASSASVVLTEGVSTSSLQGNSVTTEKIANGAVQPTDLSPTVLSNTFWRLGGNAGTTPDTQFLGTTDTRPLKLRVNNQQALRLEWVTNQFGVSGAVNVIYGPVNWVADSIVGATISGGGAFRSEYGGYTNSISADFGTIGGGFANSIQAVALGGTIAGGEQNTIGTFAMFSTLGGGSGNAIQSDARNSTIGGGYDNSVGENTFAATIGGGFENTIQTNAPYGTVGGGSRNHLRNYTGGSTIGGGYGNNVGERTTAATIGGGIENTIQTNASYGTVAGGAANVIQDNAACAVVGGGTNNTAGGENATVAGGRQNLASGWFSFVGGGGWNTASGNSATITGGEGNSASVQGATVPGGQMNTAGGLFSFAAGRRAKALHDGSFVWGDSTWEDFASTSSNQFLIRASGGVGINTNNPAGHALNVAGTVRAAAFISDGSQLFGPPPGMVLIPAGAFTMGDTLDGSGNAVTAAISAFYMDVNEVSWSQWQSVYFWATNHGYGFVYSVYAAAGKAANHPVQTVNWYDGVKWCNARSQQAGKTPVYYTDAGLTQVYTNGEPTTVYPNWAARGYRLPTEAEWEKAARGGLSGQRFPWGNVINQNLANYHGSTCSYSYDLGPNGYHAAFTNGVSPNTSPAGYFAVNGYGLNDMGGNVFEWCWDWYGTPYAGGSDPRGPASGSLRVWRGGGWYGDAIFCRTAHRAGDYPAFSSSWLGFRSVLPSGQ